MPTESTLEEKWYQFLSQGEAIPRHMHHFFGLLPANPLLYGGN